MKKLYILLFFLLFSCNFENNISNNNQSEISNFEIIDILSPDNDFNSRTFASVVKINDNYEIFYSVRDKSTMEYSIYKNSSSNLKQFSNSNELEIIPNKTDKYNFLHTYVPYVFYENNMYYMFFTARKESDDLFEAIYIATSLDSVNWEIDLNPIIIPENQWEGNEIENWGLIKYNNLYYMNFESAGPNRLQTERHIGTAVSSDLITWDKISQEPQIKNGVYCASFFLYDDQFYMVVPNGYRFKVFKFTSFGTISEKNFIGYYDPFEENFDITLDTPEIVTESINKEINVNETFQFVFGNYRNGEWYTSLIEFENVNEFLNLVKKS